MSLKTGTISKTKIFATVMNNDPTLYTIDQKYIKKINGMIPDRINPFIIDEEKMNFDSSKDGTP